MNRRFTRSTLAAVVTLGVIAGSGTSAAATQAAENFLKADADGDGALTLEELRTLIDLNATHNIGRSQMIQRSGRYGAAFDRLDANSDGLATKEEISARAAITVGDQRRALPSAPEDRAWHH